ncbi:MAG: hypothetical protein H7Y37_15830 [Anaerolineae bacterium]|nr:hypothetical protein [Gloeobacterales cyanobacterium ES-bin-313]
MLLKNAIAATALFTVLLGVSLPSNAAVFQIALPEQNLGNIGPNNSQAGPYVYTDSNGTDITNTGGNAQALNGVFNTTLFNDTIKARTTDYNTDTVYSILLDGQTATSRGSINLVQAQIDALSKVTLSFDYEIVTSGTLTVQIDGPDGKKAIGGALAVTGQTYTPFSDNTLKQFFTKPGAYSILWTYNDAQGTGDFGFNSALITVEAVPEPSEFLGIISFGVMAFGGGLIQKKRRSNRVA